jgi:hypothetical protein
MKRQELPQDSSALTNITRELHYVKDEDGKYRTGLSTGWEVKSSALNNAWEEVNEQIEEAQRLVNSGDKSPIYLLMFINRMDLSILSSYTGYWKLCIKQHFKPKVFAKLSDKKLKKYAAAFNMEVEELKNYNA